VWFSIDNLVLVSAQAACVAAPAAGLPVWAQRFRRRAWALVLPLSIAAVVAAIELLPSTADVLTWVALLLVPTGCGLALGWAARGARPMHAGPAILLLAIAWGAPHTRIAEISTTVLIAGSAVTLGRLLAGAAPLRLLKAGLLAMAAVDAWLVFSGHLQAPNDVLVAASPGLGLPQLQSASFGIAGLGYGDFFAAAVLGGILAAERGPQLAAAVGLVVVSLCWDQLFLVYDLLPATIPPAVVLVIATLWRARLARGSRPHSPRGGLPPACLVARSSDRVARRSDRRRPTSPGLRLPRMMSGAVASAHAGLMTTHLHTSPQQRRVIPVVLGFLTLLLLRRQNAHGEWVAEAAVAAATLLALHRARWPKADVPDQRRRSHLVHGTTLLFGGVLLFALVIPAFAAHSVRSSLQVTPEATTRSFLTAAVVNHDGFTASRYLSPRARLSFEDRSPAGPTADSFFSASKLTLGGLRVQSNAQLKRLSYRVLPAGRDRVVEVGHDGQWIRFRLRHASPTDRGEFHAPLTTWRIDSSVAMLGTASPGASAASGRV